MIKTTARGILLDIEGTTSSISFVYDVMFPFVREQLASFLLANWNSDSLTECLPSLATDIGQPSVEQWFRGKSEDDQRKAVHLAVIGMMDDDIKATGLKQLQGLVWKSGFHSGELVAHLFEDVAPAIRQWQANGVDVRIYSSGSIAAQKLFFGHTIAGDLLGDLNGHYDMTTGPKQESASYTAIAEQFDCPADEVIFISDIPAELTAAKAAGMQAVLSQRPGNHPVPADHGFAAIESFAELDLQFDP